ncbi:hypothetical protein JHK85_049253 [Glycine max]|nr:hypothetical protein JHK85_049253 [Glycine max]
MINPSPDLPCRLQARKARFGKAFVMLCGLYCCSSTCFCLCDEWLKWGAKNSS